MTALCEQGDFERVIEIISNAFMHVQPVVDAMFPSHDTPEGRVYGAKRLLQSKQNDPQAWFIKVADYDSGEIMGQAKWIVIQGEPVQELTPGETIEGEDEKEYARSLVEQYQIPRNEAIKSTNSQIMSQSSNMIAHVSTRVLLMYRIVLDLLSVDPKFQGRRVGSLLVKWGCDHADKLGIEVW